MCVCVCVSSLYLIHEDFMERNDVLVSLTKLQDGNLTTRVIPEKSHITREVLLVRMPLATLHNTRVATLHNTGMATLHNTGMATLHNTGVATAQHPDLILMILTAYCVPVVLSVHTL